MKNIFLTVLFFVIIVYFFALLNTLQGNADAGLAVGMNIIAIFAFIILVIQAYSWEKWIAKFYILVVSSGSIVIFMVYIWLQANSSIVLPSTEFIAILLGIWLGIQAVVSSLVILTMLNERNEVY